jgi:tetratricopeptide (TPR) repeat protein
MAFEGELKDLSLGDVVQSIRQNRLTGTLALSLERKNEARIFFREGKIAALAPPAQDGAGPGAPFGDVLRRMGVLSAEVLAAARKKRGRKQLKTVLEECGALAADAYRAAAERYLFDAAADLFLRPRGRFRFQEGEAPKGSFDPELEAAHAALDPQAVALEGVRRHDEWARISKEIGERDAVYLPARRASGEESGGPSAVSLEARRLFELLEDCRTLEECLPDLPCGRFGAATALAELLSKGLVVPAKEEDLAGRARDAESRGELAEAERLYRLALKIGPDSIPVRECLARVLERAGRAEDAGKERVLLGGARARAGDFGGAIADYRRAADLLPEETAPLKRIVEIARERRDAPQTLAAGKRLAERYLALRLSGRAADVLGELVQEFPEDVDLRMRRAEALVATGERREAARAWKEVARLREKALDERAAIDAYDRALEADESDKEARARIEALRSGRLEARRRRARRMGRLSVATFLLALLTVTAAREVFAFRALRSWTALALHPVGGSDGRALCEGFLGVARTYPATLAASEARALAGAALFGEITRIDILVAKGEWRDARQRVERLERMKSLGWDAQAGVAAARRRLDAALALAIEKIEREKGKKTP